MWINKKKIKIHIHTWFKVQRQNALSHTAQDSQALWEDELKSRSKLGLRMAELEKERGELNTQVITYSGLSMI